MSTVETIAQINITLIGWHPDFFEPQDPGTMIFFLLSQPTDRDTEFSSQVAALKLPRLIAFFKTLKTVHSSDEEADYLRQGRGGGSVRRNAV
ncbi:hypothetical protein OBBRIDRAFT_888976, partial [Obba rivulosa]